MDLLSQRYASPNFFIDGMIQTGRFCEFVFEFIKASNRDKEDAADWEFFLHKVWDKTFTEFRDEMKTTAKNQNMSKRTIETTVKDSMDILNQFNPNEGGE